MRFLTVEHRVHGPLPSIFPVPPLDVDFYLDGPYARRRGREAPGMWPEELALQPRPTSGLVMCDGVGQPVNPDTYSARFRSLCRAAGLPVLRAIHNVRHTLATALDEAGVPEHQAAALLGHDVQTYRRFYLVTDDDAAASTVEGAGRLFAVL